MFIYNLPLWIPVIAIFALSLAASELGFRYARKRLVLDSEQSIVSAIRTSTVGFVALLLGFSFAVTTSRFHERARLVIDEANSIGTCYLRAGLLAEPASSQIRGALRRYLAFRLESYKHGLDAQAYAGAASGMRQGLDELWSAVERAVRADHELALTSAIVPAANEVIDQSGIRAWMRRYHLPPAVVLLLGLSIVICGAMIGHALGEVGQRHTVLSFALIFLIVVVALVVFDFDRPRGGFIRVDQTPLLQLQETMQERS